MYMLTGFRITPAGAGKTPKRRFCTIFNRDHPRRCGENLLPFELLPKSPGSPPQVRGKLALAIVDFDTIGITPAGAGKT